MGATDAVHPADQTLHWYGLGKLDDASSKMVQKHFGACSDCQGILDRFQVEIRNAARLHHTNIVTAHSASRLGESFDVHGIVPCT
jgi:anti-sigma factor ChrR (cupin superfamily)